MTSGTKSTFTSRAFKKMDRHLVFRTPKALSTTHLALDSLALNLPSTAFRTGSGSEWGEQRYWLRQARVPAVTNKMPAWRWVQLAHKKGAAFQDPGIMDTTRKDHNDVQKAALVVANGLELD
ncbi:uncharacterized protein V6R79_005038 [Siganus canaliculatus]